MPEQIEQLFFDPFAESSEQLFDSLKSHEVLFAHYEAGKVEHDYSADEFVADTEALMLDARFVGQFEQAQAIAAQMHLLCAEDHGLRSSMNDSLLFAQPAEHDDHDHSILNHMTIKERKTRKDEEKERKEKRAASLLVKFFPKLFAKA